MTNVSVHGFWLLLEGRELFLPFATFPWFKSAAIGQLVNVELPRPDYLRWPDLDVDLHVDSILHPDAYPLVSNPPHGAKNSSSSEPDMRPEYDFAGGVRGKYAARYAEGTNTVVIDPELARKQVRKTPRRVPPK